MGMLRRARARWGWARPGTSRPGTAGSGEVWLTITLIATAVGVILLSASAHADSTASCDGKPMSFHRHRAKAILAHAYKTTYYSEHRTATREQVEAFQAHKRCIRVAKVRDKLGQQRQDLASFQKARIAATPYAGGGYYWAIPFSVASCESGGGGMPDYTPSFGLSFGGAYGLLVSTWQQFGGGQWASQANLAPPYAQDIIASRTWRTVGPSGWACA